MMAARATQGERRVVFMPNLGVYLDRPPLAIPDRALQDCLNIRIKEGEIRNENMGWRPFYDMNLDGNPVLLIDEFFNRSGTRTLIFGTNKDLYYFDDVTSTVKYITPRYETGQMDVLSGLGGGIAGGGADFTNVSVGDMIWIGDTGKVDQDADWREILTIHASGSPITFTPVWDGSTGTEDYTVRKLFDGTFKSYWVPETFPDAQPANEDEWFATNGVGHSIVKWNGSDDQVTVIDGTLGFTCGCIKRYKNMMLYGNLLESGENKPQAIRNSALSTPENVTTDEATEFAVVEGVDSLLSMEPLADIIVAYANKSINLTQYVGPPVGFLIRTAVPGIGIVSSRSIINFGYFHKMLSHDTGYIFDGVALERHGDHVFREALRTIDPGRIEQALCHIDEQNGEVIWVIPKTTDADLDAGGPEMAITEHYLEPVEKKYPIPMAIREFPATATGHYERSTAYRMDYFTAGLFPDGFAEVSFRWNDKFFLAAFPLDLFGSADGNVYEFGTSDNQDGSAISSFARFGRFQVQDGRLKGIITRVEPAASRVGANYDLNVRIYGTSFPAGDVSKIFDKGFDLTHVERRHLSVRKAARFAEVEFGTDGTNRPFALIGYATESVQAGER